MNSKVKILKKMSDTCICQVDSKVTIECPKCHNQFETPEHSFSKAYRCKIHRGGLPCCGIPYPCCPECEKQGWKYVDGIGCKPFFLHNGVRMEEE